MTKMRLLLAACSFACTDAFSRTPQSFVFSAFRLPAARSCRSSLSPRVVQLRSKRGGESGEVSFDLTSEAFDLLSLRSFRRDALLQYDATNQSEPLRIALTALGVLFALTFPSLGDVFGFEPGLAVDAGALAGAAGSGFLFLRNRAARTARIERISREYALGDLEAIYRGVRVNTLRELRGTRRAVVLVGPGSALGDSLKEARVYRRRLEAANVAVVPVFTDGKAQPSLGGSRESAPQWLWAASKPDVWREYFDEILEARGLNSGSGDGSDGDRSRGSGSAWLALSFRGRSVGSAVGAPRWDELLGTALSPCNGDGSGNLPDTGPTDLAAAAAEAAVAAASLGEAPARDQTGAEGVAVAAEVLAAQARFYASLTGSDEVAMRSLWAGADEDRAVSEVLASGGRLDSWASQLVVGKAPKGMRCTDSDCLVVSATEAWSTTVERPVQGGTLLATQRWRRSEDGEGGWLLAAHRTIPWSAIGGTAVATLRCDGRGCVALGRTIDTRA